MKTPLNALNTVTYKKLKEKQSPIAETKLPQAPIIKIFLLPILSDAYPTAKVLKTLKEIKKTTQIVEEGKQNHACIELKANTGKLE